MLTLLAALTALVNQQAAASRRPTVGFINPAIDAIGAGPTYTNCFHDITTGNNTSAASPARFYGVAGYDLCTGWGTPAGQHLINAPNPEPLLIEPLAGFSSIGGVGGPFTVTSQSLTLTNTGTNALTWTANTSLWLSVSPGGFPDARRSLTTVTVSLNAAASNLMVGLYTATVWFTNLNDNFGQSLQYILSVISPPDITSQPSNRAVLDGATATFTVGVSGGLPLTFQWQFNGTNLTDGGNISGSTNTTLTIANDSEADAGNYDHIISNAAGVITSSNALLTIMPVSPVIITQPTNDAVVVNGTAQFAVAALGTKPFSCQWNFNTTNINGATNAVLTLTNVQFFASRQLCRDCKQCHRADPRIPTRC